MKYLDKIIAIPAMAGSC